MTEAICQTIRKFRGQLKLEDRRSTHQCDQPPRCQHNKDNRVSDEKSAYHYSGVDVTGPH